MPGFFPKGILKNNSLQMVLLVPLLGMTVIAVVLTGYISFRNGQQAVNQVAHQLRNEINSRIHEHLLVFYDMPSRINQANANAFSRGILDVKDQEILERHFWEQVQVFDSVTSINFGNTEGGLANAGREGAEGALYVIATEGFASGPFHKYATDNQGQRAWLLETLPDFDARERPWYSDAVEKGSETWSEVYVLFTGQDMALTLSRPVYDSRQQLLGVTAVNIFLGHLGDFLAGLNIGQTGQSFIMERSGLLIATSTGEKPFSAEVAGTGNPYRVEAGESAEPLTCGAAVALAEEFGGYGAISHGQPFEFRLDGRRQLGKVTPFQDPAGLDWLIVTVIPEGDFMAEIHANNRDTIILMLFSLGAIMAVGVIITGKIINPISQLNLAAGALAEGKWDQAIPDNSGIREINALSYSFNHMAGQLQQVVAGLTLEVAERQRAEEKMADYAVELEELYQQLDEEMDKARQMHEQNMADALPEVPGLSFAAHYQPAQRMGGDFYDILKSDKKLVFYLSDVSGHGLDGAMLSIFIKHTVKSYLNFSPAADLGPADILRYLAARFTQENYPEELYISIFMGVIDLESMELTYCGAGFQESPLVRWGDGHKTRLVSKNMFISTIYPMEVIGFREESLALTPGTTLFCTTDGLTEESNGGSYYMDRLPGTFHKHAWLPPHLVAQAVVEDFRRFNNGSPQGQDDITFLVLQVDANNKQVYNLELESDDQGLTRLRKEVSKLLKGLSEANSFMICLEEMVTNAIEHGSRMQREKAVYVEITVADEYIQAVVEDQGEGFDWQGKIDKPLDLEGHQDRGRGIAMARLCSDKLFYNQKGNRVTFIITPGKGGRFSHASRTA